MLRLYSLSRISYLTLAIVFCTPYLSNASENGLRFGLPVDGSVMDYIDIDDIESGQVYEQVGILNGEKKTSVSHLDTRQELIFFSIAIPAQETVLLGELIPKISMKHFWQTQNGNPPPMADTVSKNGVKLVWWPLALGSQLRAWRFGASRDSMKMYRIETNKITKMTNWVEFIADSNDVEVIMTPAYGAWQHDMGWQFREENAKWAALPRVSSDPRSVPWGASLDNIPCGRVYQEVDPRLGDFQYYINLEGESATPIKWRLAPGTTVPLKYFGNSDGGSLTLIQNDSGGWLWTTATTPVKYKLVDADRRQIYSYASGRWDLIKLSPVVNSVDRFYIKNKKNNYLSQNTRTKSIYFGPPTGSNQPQIFGYSPLSEYLFYEQNKSHYPMFGPPTGMSFREYFNLNNY